MKTPRREFLTQHRRQRYVLWALAMLMWIASLFAGAAPSSRHLRQRHRKMSLHGLTLMVKQLVLLRAADFVGLRRKRRPLFFKYGRDLRCRHLMRSILGAKLRRALHHRDPIARIAILIEALTHLDAWAARFAKRLRCGFMRLWSIPPARASVIALSTALAAPPACTDSS